MKKSSFLFLVVILSIALSACGVKTTGETVSPTPTPLPTGHVIMTLTVDECIYKQSLNDFVYELDNKDVYFQIDQSVPEEIAYSLMERYDTSWTKTSFTDVKSIAGYCSKLEKGFYFVSHSTPDGRWEFKVTSYEADGSLIGVDAELGWVKETNSFAPIEWDPGV